MRRRRDNDRRRILSKLRKNILCLAYRNFSAIPCGNKQLPQERSSFGEAQLRLSFRSGSLLRIVPGLSFIPSPKRRRRDRERHSGALVAIRSTSFRESYRRVTNSRPEQGGPALELARRYSESGRSRPPSMRSRRISCRISSSKQASKLVCARMCSASCWLTTDSVRDARMQRCQKTFDQRALIRAHRRVYTANSLVAFSFFPRKRKLCRCNSCALKTIEERVRRRPAATSRAA